MRWLVLALFVVTGASCSQWCWSDDDARAAALRHLRDLHAGADTLRRYVIVEGSPPSDRFMTCLGDSTWVAASSSTHDLAAHRPLPNAGVSVTMWVSDFDQSGEDHASIRAGYVRPDGVGEDFVLVLERAQGRWTVVGVR